MAFALVVVDNKLTTVGGRDRSEPTSSLTSLTGEGKDSKWVELFPRMPTARYSLAAVCKGKNVIAAGGNNQMSLNIVEILDTELQQWSTAASLPHAMSSASITVCEDSLYLLGGYGQYGNRTHSVFTASITDLKHPQQTAASHSAVWRRASDAPYYYSTVVSVRGQLLAIGGCDKDEKETSAIVALNPTSHSWQNSGHMITPRYWTLVVVLPSNQFIVAGGVGGSTNVEISHVV